MKKKKVNKKIRERPVAYKDYTVSTETELPYPIVLYPSFYGAFFAFKESANSNNMYLCSCSKKAVSNFVQLNSIEEKSSWNRSINYYHNFPAGFIDYLKSKGDKDLGELIQDNSNIIFKEGLCHYCNKQLPYYSYCIPMYDSKFIQNYGWYVNLKMFEFGFSDKTFIQGNTANEIDDLICELLDQNTSQENFQEYIIDWNIYEQIRKYAENLLRIHFSYPQIGQRWITETNLYNIVVSFYDKNDVIFHFRPEWLYGLELDIFIKSLNIGIEYQGIQHYKPLKHWGGETGFIKRRENDIKKKKLCDAQGVILIYFTYKEDISVELVSSRLSQYIDTK